MKNPKQPRLVTIAIMTTITVIFWVFFSVYSILTTKVAPSVSSEILAPLNPTLNSTVLNSLSDRIYVDDNEIIGPVVENEKIVVDQVEIITDDDQTSDNEPDSAQPTTEPENLQ
ncbi:hypothetical protein IPM62_00090 [Candidatus Woesebacteria bacterium]|nr:MAG: hypothetical protein IPM62_00090 [Candidatus Woesebacteria bacterium]